MSKKTNNNNTSTNTNAQTRATARRPKGGVVSIPGPQYQFLAEFASQHGVPRSKVVAALLDYLRNHPDILTVEERVEKVRKVIEVAS